MIVRNIIKSRSGFFLQYIPLNFLIGITNRNIILPFYHTVSDTGLPHISNLYTVHTVQQFINDLDFFCKYYKPISAEELFHIITEKETVNKPVFHLSFDDGLKQIYSVIAPVLVKKGIPASFFVNTAFIDNKDLFYRYKVSLIIEFVNNNKDIDLTRLSSVAAISAKTIQEFITGLNQYSFTGSGNIDEIAAFFKIDFNNYLRTNQPYLNSPELKELIEKGFTVGSHSINHPQFNNLNFTQQQIQISESFNFLSSQFGINNRYFSFPFSDEGISASLFKWLYEIENCRLSFGISGLKDDLYKTHLHRIPMENLAYPASPAGRRQAGSIGFSEKIIKSEYFYFLLKALVNKNRIKRNE